IHQIREHRLAAAAPHLLAEAWTALGARIDHRIEVEDRERLARLAAERTGLEVVQDERRGRTLARGGHRHPGAETRGGGTERGGDAERAGEIQGRRPYQAPPRSNSARGRGDASGGQATGPRAKWTSLTRTSSTSLHCAAEPGVRRAVDRR